MYNAYKSNLYYDIFDLANFHAAVKTRSLVILSGMSGTGKSRLVEVYAQALGIKPECKLIIPVRPSWNDDSDLLGYVDLNKMVYRPSETGFIEILRDAEKNKDQIYLVCFDELNLARVEHYFSQLLTILEKPARSDRKLRIYSDSLKGFYNASEYPSEITIGDNIFFVGTVNIDESTYHFSDKVLDRSNVIQLNVLDYSTEWKRLNYGSVPPLTWSKDEFVKLINEPEDNDFIEFRRFLWEMHQCLQAVDVTLGVGPRVVKQIERYLCNFSSINESSEDEKVISFDIQLVQRIFTKIRGSEDKLRKLFVTENGTCSVLDIVFDKYSKLSRFEKSRAALARKKEELKIYGYCIKLPFTLEFIKEYENAVVIPCSLFYDNVDDAQKSSIPTISFQENDPISIVFHAPADGRLYLDALDVIPGEYGCTLDYDGRIYYGASDKVLPLYKLDGNEFDELRVDNFLIEVKTEGKSYFGWLRVEPKQLYKANGK